MNITEGNLQAPQDDTTDKIRLEKVQKVQEIMQDCLVKERKSTLNLRQVVTLKQIAQYSQLNIESLASIIKLSFPNTNYDDLLRAEGFTVQCLFKVRHDLTWDRVCNEAEVDLLYSLNELFLVLERGNK